MPVLIEPQLWAIEAPFHLELVRVPAGEFRMGSDPARDNFTRPEELPAHTVVTSGFSIGKYEVTNAQFAVYARASQLPFEFPASAEEHPVVHQSWHQAAAFCDWLGGVLARHVRLPTEAEWEKAARGVDGRIYPWGDPWNPDALNINLAGGETAAVTAHSPAGDSPYGAADLVGNVFEWTADWYQDATYADRAAAGAPAVDPTGPAQGTHRVMRGSAYHFRQSGTRAAKRSKYVPTSRCYDIGFRIAISDP